MNSYLFSTANRMPQMQGKLYCRVFRTYRRRVSTVIFPLVSVVSGVILSCCAFLSSFNVHTLDINSQRRLTTPKFIQGNTFKYQGVFHHRSLLNTSEKQGEYPKDLFTIEQKQQGAILCHIFGMCYMFLALAIACDEFFIPALGVITEKLSISKDVAGATFMAAGGSAPELFTSFIGTFADPESNVGFGTIVGSAVFNVLFVIGMCAVFSKGVLKLTWWPLFRDCFFYSLALILLIAFFIGERIEWWESLVLLSAYAVYVTFMKFNHTFERWIKGKLRSNKVSSVDIKDPEAVNPGVNKTDLYLEKALEYLGSASKHNSEMPCFHYGALQLVIQTIDPIGDASIAVKVKSLRQLSTGLTTSNEEQNKQLFTYVNHDLSNGTILHSTNDGNGNRTVETSGHGKDRDLGIGTSTEDMNSKRTPQGSRSSSLISSEIPVVKIYSGHINNIESPMPGMCDDRKVRRPSSPSKVSRTMIISSGSQQELLDTDDDDDDANNDLFDDDKPIDLSWPKGWKDRLVYIFRTPLLLPMYCTMFDVRRPDRSQWYPWTFVVSILWIGMFSYLMVWWAIEVGHTFGIPPAVMGLTFVAAGTSIPDLITSVLVARKGFGDMAVSSSIGSNMFDITVGLPLPWISYSAIHFGNAVVVSSSGLLCSVLMLFLMLLTVVATIAASKWRMSKFLGGCMFFLYIIFVILSLLLQYDVIKCISG